MIISSGGSQKFIYFKRGKYPGGEKGDMGVPGDPF